MNRIYSLDKRNVSGKRPPLLISHLHLHLDLKNWTFCRFMTLIPFDPAYSFVNTFILHICLLNLSMNSSQLALRFILTIQDRQLNFILPFAVRHKVNFILGSLLWNFLCCCFCLIIWYLYYCFCCLNFEYSILFVILIFISGEVFLNNNSLNLPLQHFL